jgi:hypothetical protein
VLVFLVAAAVDAGLLLGNDFLPESGFVSVLWPLGLSLLSCLASPADGLLAVVDDFAGCCFGTGGLASGFSGFSFSLLSAAFERLAREFVDVSDFTGPLPFVAGVSFFPTGPVFFAAASFGFSLDAVTTLSVPLFSFF